jgi:hypothetical protein
MNTAKITVIACIAGDPATVTVELSDDSRYSDALADNAKKQALELMKAIEDSNKIEQE